MEFPECNIFWNVKFAVYSWNTKILSVLYVYTNFKKNQFAIMIYSMALFLSTGSPFHPKVVDPNKVVVVGGWQQILDTKDRVNLVVGEPKRLIFDVSQAGPGMLFNIFY